jgi:uncharacterized membrane protein
LVINRENSKVYGTGSSSMVANYGDISMTSKQTLVFVLNGAVTTSAESFTLQNIEVHCKSTFVHLCYVFFLCMK